MRMWLDNDNTRKELSTLARRRKARIVEFKKDRPTNWRPTQVRNPNGRLDDYFTDSSAWELIADVIEKNHPIEVIDLEKPQGAKGYVMKVDTGSGIPEVYIKLQLGSGKIIGRSFHYSHH